MAVKTRKGNMHVFKNYFLDDGGPPDERENKLTVYIYAWHWSILALSMSLNIDMLEEIYIILR